MSRWGGSSRGIIASNEIVPKFQNQNTIFRKGGSSKKPDDDPSEEEEEDDDNKLTEWEKMKKARKKEKEKNISRKSDQEKQST